MITSGARQPGVPATCRGRVPKVAEENRLAAAVLGDQEVFQFYVPVDVPRAVDKLERESHLAALSA